MYTLVIVILILLIIILYIKDVYKRQALTLRVYTYYGHHFFLCLSIYSEYFLLETAVSVFNVIQSNNNNSRVEITRDKNHSVFHSSQVHSLQNRRLVVSAEEVVDKFPTGPEMRTFPLPTTTT